MTVRNFVAPPRLAISRSGTRGIVARPGHTASAVGPMRLAKSPRLWESTYMDGREPTYQQPLPTGVLERELSRTMALGVIRSFSLRVGKGERARRRWIIVLPNGELKSMEPTQVEAFCLG